MSMIVNTIADVKPQPKAKPEQLVLVGIIDLGTQPYIFKGENKGTKRMLRLNFCIPNQKHVFDDEKGPEPFHLPLKEVVVSQHEKSKLYKVYKALMGTVIKPDSDLELMLGKNCVNELTESDDGKWTNLGPDFTGLMDGIEHVKGLKTTFFYLGDMDWDVFNNLPTFLKDIIRKSPEFQALEAYESGAPDIAETTPLD